MKGQLDGKVAIVTGGGTGIGEAICLAFAREGARVVVSGLPDDPITDVVATILASGGEAVPFAGDLATEEAAKQCVDTAVAKYGRVDVLVNNAGVLLANAETDDMPVETFDEQIRDPGIGAPA